MKIELQLSSEQLNALVSCFNSIVFIYGKHRKERVLKSILDEVIVKFKKKNIDIESSSNTLFEKPKKPKFSLKYYEADALEQYLIMIVDEDLNDYDRNVVRLIKDKLNQKLA